MPLGSVISVRSWKKNMQKGSRLGDSREGSEMAHSELYERRISDQRRRDCDGGKGSLSFSHPSEPRLARERPIPWLRVVYETTFRIARPVPFELSALSSSDGEQSHFRYLHDALHRLGWQGI